MAGAPYREQPPRPDPLVRAQVTADTEIRKPIVKTGSMRSLTRWASATSYRGTPNRSLTPVRWREDTSTGSPTVRGGPLETADLATATVCGAEYGVPYMLSAARRSPHPVLGISRVITPPIWHTELTQRQPTQIRTLRNRGAGHGRRTRSHWLLPETESASATSSSARGGSSQRVN
jgi:hypothetical protein